MTFCSKIFYDCGTCKYIFFNVSSNISTAAMGSGNVPSVGSNVYFSVKEDCRKYKSYALCHEPANRQMPRNCFTSNLNSLVFLGVVYGEVGKGDSY